MKNTQQMEQDFRQLLSAEKYSSQAELMDALKAKGYTQINQSKISRMLAKLGAVRIRNVSMKTVYSLPTELVAPSVQSQIKRLVLEIDENHSLIILRTCPGAAQLIARILDSLGKEQGILGTIAGDDTVFVAPVQGVGTTQLIEQIHRIF